MKLRLGDTVIELANITYADKPYDNVVEIHFVGESKSLQVFCGEHEKGKATFNGSADELITKIEKSRDPDNITFASSIS